MRALALRTQLVVVVAFLQLYLLGVGLAYWNQSRAHDRLEQSFQHDLVVLSRLPRLRDGLRQLDLLTDHYLLSGDAQWLEKRRDILEQIRVTSLGLSSLSSQGAERDILSQLDRRLASYLAQQSQWISRRESGRLPASQSARLISRRKGFDDLLNLIIKMKDANIDRLEQRRQASAAASRLNLILILLAGLAAGASIAFFLSRYMVDPIITLQRYAGQWRLGQQWSFAPARVSREVSGLLASMKELTGRLNSQYQREHELAEFKGKLVSMVSHEYNNVLSTLSMVSLLLREDESPQADEKRKGYYDMLDGNIRSLSLAANNLLDMGRLESGQFAVKPVRIELSRLVEESLRGMDLLRRRKKQELKAEFPAEKLFVNADPQALALVVTNLIGNAIKYTPEKGRITVGVNEETAGRQEAVRFYCKDTGIGISEEDQRKIFSGYYRTESGQKTAKGFGLGLALAASVVEAHGSRLKVESKPGAGSQFSFLLPLWK